MKKPVAVTSWVVKQSAAVTLIILLLLIARVTQAETEAKNKADQTIFHADVVGRGNPTGIMLLTGGLLRWNIINDPELKIPDSYTQVGAILGINPAYAQVSVYGEWKPALYTQMRLQYDYYGFFGTEGSLLSFPSAQSSFGKNEIDARKGHEESTTGHRLLFQPVLTGKIGPVIVRNTTDIGYYIFNGKGPYFYEGEYDTLLKDGDLLVNNNAAVLIMAWQRDNDGILLAGPFYEITHAVDAEITRQRTGIQYYWVPSKKLWGVDQPRIYGQIGMNLQDRNRDNEAFFRVGVGFDF